MNHLLCRLAFTNTLKYLDMIYIYQINISEITFLTQLKTLYRKCGKGFFFFFFLLSYEKLFNPLKNLLNLKTSN